MRNARKHGKGLDIYNFINSPHIAELCRKAKKTWNPFEMALIIAQSYKTLAEKHDAWRKLILKYKGAPVKQKIYLYGLWEDLDAVFEQIQSVIEYNELFIKIFKTPEHGAVYECILIDDDSHYYGLHCIYNTFEEGDYVTIPDRKFRESLKLKGGNLTNVCQSAQV